MIARVGMDQVVGRDDVARAREAIGDRLHRTPTLTSRSLSEATGACVYLKAELLQKTGSFKPRGVLTSLARLTREERRRGVISISAGNHAQALAWAAAADGVDALLVMWRGADTAKLDATRGYGAQVDLTESNPGAAFERLEELIAETGRTFVHPFDSAPTIAGQGTLGLEIAEDVPNRDVIVVPVGGGGLVSGIASAVDTRVVGVEPEHSAALHAGLAAGKPVTIEPRSVADGLNAPFAGELPLAICRERRVESILVTDAEVEAGMRFLYTRAKLACEPAGAAAVAALMAGKVALEPRASVVAVVSGGNVATETAVAILKSR